MCLLYKSIMLMIMLMIMVTTRAVKA